LKLIAVQDRNKHNSPIYAYGVCKVFVLCVMLGGQFEKNIETIESNFFYMDELPHLAVEKNNESQIRMCFEAYKTKNWEVIFD
ncbi:MAG: ADP-ribose pyrophosphatase, partial [Turicibacter sp.]